MKKYYIVTESGSDLPQSIIEKHGLYVLPMYVAFEGNTYKDGSLPIEELCGYYDRTGKTPTTSAVNPGEYTEVIKAIQAENPDAIIMHLCYSAILTCTYQNALIGAEGLENIYHIDTLGVSCGLGIVVMRAAELIERRPDIEPDELISKIKMFAVMARFAFIPGNLDYLRAGGRVSNAQYLGAGLLNLKPCVESQDGKLVSVKKYRGSMLRATQLMLKDFFAKYNIDKSHICLVNTNRVGEELMALVEKCARELGALDISWFTTGSVLTCHGGPGGFGVSGLVLQS